MRSISSVATLRLEDTKTGRSVRPLGQAAAAALKSVPRIQGNPYVLPGSKTEIALDGDQAGVVRRALRGEAQRAAPA